MKNKNLVSINTAFPWVSKLKYVFIALGVLLIGWWVFNSGINKLGLRDAWDAWTENKIFKAQVDMKDPKINILADALRLIEKKAEAWRKKYYNNFPMLIKGTEIFQQETDSVYNALYGKQFSSKPVNQVSNQSLVITKVQNRGDAPLDLNQFKHQVGDTTYYNFVLNRGQMTTEINLADQTGQQIYYWRIRVVANPIVVVSDNGKKRDPFSGLESIRGNWLKFSLEAVNDQTKVELKVFPVNGSSTPPTPANNNATDNSGVNT